MKKAYSNIVLYLLYKALVMHWRVHTNQKPGTLFWSVGLIAASNLLIVKYCWTHGKSTCQLAWSLRQLLWRFKGLGPLWEGSSRASYLFPQRNKVESWAKDAWTSRCYNRCGANKESVGQRDTMWQQRPMLANLISPRWQSSWWARLSATEFAFW